MPFNHLIFCRPLSSPSIFPHIRVFSNELILHIRWPRYWSFSIRSSNECSGLISFMMGWLDILEVQGALQHYSSKAWILHYSAFFIVQLSHPYMTTGKITALTRWTFAGSVMSLFCNMLPRFYWRKLDTENCYRDVWAGRRSWTQPMWRGGHLIEAHTAHL